MASVMAVRMKPGAAPLTVALRDPISNANDFVKPISAAFDAVGSGQIPAFLRAEFSNCEA